MSGYSFFTNSGNELKVQRANAGHYMFYLGRASPSALKDNGIVLAFENEKELQQFLSELKDAADILAFAVEKTMGVVNG